MDNPNLIEEFPREYEVTQFEKIRISAKRAKDLHNAHKSPLINSNRTAAYVALEEYNAGAIRTVYKVEEPPLIAADDADDGDDDE